MAIAVNMLTLIPWVIFYAYWGAAFAFEAVSGRLKRTERRQSFFSGRFQGFLLAVAIILVVVNFNGIAGTKFISDMSVAYAGLTIAFIGIGFAIWARRHLGANWSSSVVVKKGHELVTSGPYAIVRHPIYAGITLAMVGCTISSGTFASLLSIPVIVAFSLTRISGEEKLMCERFGKAYAEYAKKVKAYVPGFW